MDYCYAQLNLIFERKAIRRCFKLRNKDFSVCIFHNLSLMRLKLSLITVKNTAELLQPLHGLKVLSYILNYNLSI